MTVFFPWTTVKWKTKQICEKYGGKNLNYMKFERKNTKLRLMKIVWKTDFSWNVRPGNGTFLGKKKNHLFLESRKTNNWRSSESLSPVFNHSTVLGVGDEYFFSSHFPEWDRTCFTPARCTVFEVYFYKSTFWKMLNWHFPRTPNYTSIVKLWNG